MSANTWEIGVLHGLEPAGLFGMRLPRPNVSRSETRPEAGNDDPARQACGLSVEAATRGVAVILIDSSALVGMTPGGTGDPAHRWRG
jgi:hypothetical protein